MHKRLLLRKDGHQGNGRISLSSNWKNVEILELGDVQTTPRKLSMRQIGIRNVIEVKMKFYKISFSS